MESHKAFGQRIRAVRTKAKLSREFIAERVGIGANYLGQIERGEKWPALEVITKIAKSLSVPTSTFFDFEGTEVDPQRLRSKIHSLLENRDPKELQQALRLLKALFNG